MKPYLIIFSILFNTQMYMMMMYIDIIMYSTFDSTRILKDFTLPKINKTLEFLMVLTIKQSNLYVSNYFTLTIITDI